MEAKFHGLVDGLIGEKAGNEIVTVLGGLEELADIGAVIQTCNAGSK